MTVVSLRLFTSMGSSINEKSIAITPTAGLTREVLTMYLLPALQAFYLSALVLLVGMILQSLSEYKLQDKT